MTARDLLMALARRYWFLAEFHQGTSPDVDFKDMGSKAEAIKLQGQLQWRDWTRYPTASNRKWSWAAWSARWNCTATLAPTRACLSRANGSMWEKTPASGWVNTPWSQPREY